MKSAYANGVPMGADLVGKADGAPDFLVMAMRDAHSAPLQRIQIVKGWIDEAGKAQEKVFDVACSDGGTINPATASLRRQWRHGRREDLRVQPGQGRRRDCAPSWSDPEFDPEANALLLRPRAGKPDLPLVDLGCDPPQASSPIPHLEKTIQERAYTSPIWFIPTKPARPHGDRTCVARRTGMSCKRAAREPLVHFLAIGAALFVRQRPRSTAPTKGRESDTIVISEGRVNQIAESFVLLSGRLPTPRGAAGPRR